MKSKNSKLKLNVTILQKVNRWCYIYILYVICSCFKIKTILYFTLKNESFTTFEHCTFHQDSNTLHVNGWQQGSGLYRVIELFNALNTTVLIFQVRKATAFSCNSSYVSVKYLNCSVDIYSEDLSYVNMYIEAKKPVFRMLCDVHIFTRFKNSKTLTQILMWPKIDMCKLEDDANSYSVIRNYMNFVSIVVYSFCRSVQLT